MTKVKTLESYEWYRKGTTSTVHTPICAYTVYKECNVWKSDILMCGYAAPGMFKADSRTEEKAFEKCEEHWRKLIKSCLKKGE